MFETDQYKQAMVYAQDLFKAGLYHPQEPRIQHAVGPHRLHGAQHASSAWTVCSRRPTGAAPTRSRWTPASHITLVPPFSADGQTKPAVLLRPTQLRHRPGQEGVRRARQGDAAHPQLHCRRRSAAQEYELFAFGVKGVDFNYDEKGNPVLTDRARPKSAQSYGVVQPHLAVALLLLAAGPVGAAARTRATRSCWRRWASRTPRSARSRRRSRPRARSCWTASAAGRRTSSPVAAPWATGSSWSKTGRPMAATRSRRSWPPPTRSSAVEPTSRRQQRHLHGHAVQRRLDASDLHLRCGYPSSS